MPINFKELHMGQAPVDNFSCFMRVKKGYVLSDNGAKQFFPQSSGRSLPCCTQHGDIHHSQDALVGENS